MATSMPTAALLAVSSGGADNTGKPPAPVQLPSRAVVGAIESAFLREQVRQQLLGTPNLVVPPRSDDTASDDQSPHQVDIVAQTRRRTSNEKKRKSTYYARKDEMAELHQEIAMLQKELGKAKGQAPEHEARLLVSAMRTNAGLQGSVRQADLSIASAQSLMASYGTQCRSSPIGGFIHLPQNPVARQQVLAELKASRIQGALTYALTRSRFLSLTTFSKQIDSFETVAGDFVTTHWEITPLEEARSVEQAYRELLYFTDTQEMSMTEKLGMLTIRESESEPVDGAQTVRMMSKHESGVESDSNLAVFSQYFESSETLQQPHAVLAVDFVDQDDLYPPHTNTRIRKDVASLTLITEVPSASRGGRPVVTLVRWAFVRVNNSAHATRAALEEVAREGVGKWCDVMLKCVRERLAWHAE